MSALPDSIGVKPVLTMVEEVKIWTPDNMYEHVNGEAELLKRYGAVNLAYAAYENEGGDYLSADIMDMGATLNAFGLYSLYAGCNGDQYESYGATVLPGDFTSYAFSGRHFMRIDFEASGGITDGKKLVDHFLSKLQKVLPPSEPLPLVTERLKKMARKPCEVGYHPEHIDYDLESGPGFSWIGPSGGLFFVRLLSSPDDAEHYAAALRSKTVLTVLAEGSAVAWSKSPGEEAEGYLLKVVRQLGEH
jgi:hypothetical protein